MVICDNTRGHRSYKKMRVISKVSITGQYTIFVKITSIKATSVLSIIFFIMLGDAHVTTYDLQKA